MKERVERKLKTEKPEQRESVADEVLLGKEIAFAVETAGADSAAASNGAEKAIQQGKAALDKIKFKSPEKKKAAEGKLQEIATKIRESLAEFREATYMFMKLAVFGGAIFIGPHNPFATEAPEQKVQRARQELKVNGITSEQRRAYKFVVNDVLYRAITPIGYRLDDAQTLLKKLVYGREDEQSKKTSQNFFSDTTFFSKDVIDSRNDTWRLYLGLSQAHNTFDISEYRPPESIRPQGKEAPYFLKINSFWKDFLSSAPDYSPREVIKDVVKQGSRTYGHYKVAGRLWITSGVDEKGHYIAYYDRWDLDKNKIEGEKGFFGKPLEIYDRLYYDPKTFEPIGEKLN